MKDEIQKLGRVLVAFSALAGCAAGGADDEGSLVGVEEVDPGECPVIDEDACLVSDIAACCVTAGIKYEYEWIDAKKRGDAEATTTHRARLVELLDHGCGLGSEDACRTLRQVEAGTP